jgi:hypothetical protein
MPERPTVPLEKLLNHPDVIDAVADVNRELKARMAHQPPLCAVFSNACTQLEIDPQYRFEIDREIGIVFSGGPSPAATM